jgi:hypothetical protein
MNLSATTTQPTAALAGVPSGVQSHGVWTGRRQAFIRFATEAETAQMYTAGALVKELTRLTQRSVVHSVGIAGRDPLGNSEFLLTALPALELNLPVLLDTDGQRPDRVASFRGAKGLTVIQVSATLGEGDAAFERQLETLKGAAAIGVRHALAVTPAPDAPDAVLLRAIERVHGAAPGTEIVLHPVGQEKPTVLDRRWATLLDQATALHADVRLVLRVPPPAGLR